MLRSRVRVSGVQGIALVAITYIYFLIFAQFAFLRRLGEFQISGTHFKVVMGAMAIGGILFSLLVPRIKLCSSTKARLRIGLGGCGVIAWLTLFPLSFLWAIAVSFLIGASLGLLTVTLAANLRDLLGEDSLLLKVGLGTGIGYFVCNFPPLFTASSMMQAETAGILCLAACCLPIQPIFTSPEKPAALSQPPFAFLRVLAALTALVWLDSAAFYIIQNTPALKAGTWQESIHLWANAVLHLIAAVASASWLRSKGAPAVLSGAFLFLGCACFLLLSPAGIPLASVLYPVGVSLYSVALVAYPSLLSSAPTPAERGREAGWIYAIAGWSASVLGIGMAQNLGHVPPAFVALAAIVVLLPWTVNIVSHRKRELIIVSVVLLSALGMDRILRESKASSLSQIERGRQVYIAEGCISCHSQYVRPNTQDVVMWGPVQSLELIHQQRPPLIGNRRQGPDLSEVGLRRSSLWLEAHFFNPAQVSGASIMPPFGFLFRDSRGEDLVAYLTSLKSTNAPQQISAELHWYPSSAALAVADPAKGQRLYQKFCATCHSPEGRTRIAWQSSFKQPPSDILHVPMGDPPASDTTQQRLIRLAQIAKFGIPGSDMPGHEYLPDDEIASISLYLLRNANQPPQQR